MKNNKKIIAAAVLAAVCFTGCSTNIESGSAPQLYSTTTSSESSSSSSSSTPSTSSSEETISSEPAVSSDSSASGTSDNYSSVSAPASSSGNAVSSEEETESKPKRNIICTVDWEEGDNSSNSDDDKSIGYKVPKTAEEKLIDELDLKDDKKSDMEKLCILGKWFNDYTEYDYSLIDTAEDIIASGNSETVEYEVNYFFTNHGGKCSTYARTACLVLSECGIDTLYCRSTNANHAWNAVKIDGEWTYTDFVGGPDTLILGSSRHGVPNDTSIEWCHLKSYGYGGAAPDKSEINTDLRLYDFGGKELEVHEEANGFSYVNSSGEGWSVKF